MCVVGGKNHRKESQIVNCACWIRRKGENKSTFVTRAATNSYYQLMF